VWPPVSVGTGLEQGGALPGVWPGRIRIQVAAIAWTQDEVH
jgi:hypothetical protein